MKMHPLAAGLVAASIWGGMYVVSDVVLETIPAFSLLTIRLLLGIFTLGLVFRARGTVINRDRIAPILLVGFVGYGISLGFQFLGTKLSTAANGALITSATPAFVALFAVWLLQEKLTRVQTIAIIVATAGVLLILDPRTAQLSPNTFQGNILLLGAALTWGLYSVLVRKYTNYGYGVMEMTFILFFGGLPLTLPLSAWEIYTQGFGTISMGIILGVLYLGVISTAISMYLWNYAFARLPASRAALAFFAQPVVGAGLSALLLKEKLPFMFFVGGILILVGVYFASVYKPLAKRNQER